MVEWATQIRVARARRRRTQPHPAACAATMPSSSSAKPPMILLGAAAIISSTTSAQCSGSGPIYHIPAETGVSDMNALLQHDGRTHLMHRGWEHWVSDDGGVHWRKLPPPTGLTGGMDGSLSFVHGHPVVMYDCTSVANCKPANISGGAVNMVNGDPPIIGVARPSNTSDVLLTNWSRSLSNPIAVRDMLGRPIVAGFAGPSNVWSREGGSSVEMTMIFGQSTALFRSNDSSLHNWTLINPSFYPRHGGGGGLFFPLPGVGSGGTAQQSDDQSSTHQDQPTHMLQVDLPGHPDGASNFVLGRVANDTFIVDNSTSNQLDGAGFLFAQIGSIVASNFSSYSFSFSATAANSSSSSSSSSGGGGGGSSNSRLMVAGWMSIARTISVVRELRYDPTQRQLLNYPIAGLAALRSVTPMSVHTNVTMHPGATVELISAGASAADVEVELSGLVAASSSTNASFSVGVLGGSKRDHAGRTGLVFEVQVVSGVGSGATASGQRRVTVSGACSKPARGKTTPMHCVACPATNYMLPAGQDTLSLRALVDRTAIELFVGDGHIACSGSVARVPEEGNTGVYITAHNTTTASARARTRALVVSKATVWSMGCAFA